MGLSLLFLKVSFHLCRLCRSAAVKSSPETLRESGHGKCREISGEILLVLVPQETKLESAQDFSRLTSRRSSRDVSQLQMPNFMTFIILQTFILDSFCIRHSAGKAIFGKFGRTGL